MKLKAVLDKLDDLPEALKDAYTEKDGKFYLNLEDVDTLPRVVSLKEENIKYRKRAADAEKVVKEKYDFLEDEDIEEIKAKLDKYPELEAAAAGKLDDTAIQKIVDSRLNTATAPLKRDLDKATKALGEKDKLIEDYTTKERSRTIQDSVREAVGKLQGFQSAAVEDALLYAERMLEINDEGKVLTKDGVGVTPGVDPAVWLSDMQAKKPHWWGPTSGGGAGGNRNGSGGGANPWSKDNWNMTEQGKMYKENPQRAEQMAKAANSRIGATGPTVTK